MKLNQQQSFLPSLTCLRCGRVWIPRAATLPRVCPRCKSIYWNISPNIAHKPKQHAAYNQHRYELNRENEILRQKLRRHNIKIKVLTYYGNNNLACVICGENRLPCLTLDHINGEGFQHRQQINKGAGTTFYTWLEKQGFPKGYQTLCMNDQFIKRNERTEVNKAGKRGYSSSYSSPENVETAGR